MLVLSDNAVAAITSLVDRPGLPAGAGLRIASTGDGTQPLTLSTAAAPESADLVVEGAAVDGGGARVFLDRDAADLLDDKVLDAQVSDRGAVEFLLATQ
jgi:iron-sulfur cluster assembly protein